MSPNSIELHRVRCCEQVRPMRRVECWQEREAVIDQVDAISDEDLASVGHDRPHPAAISIMSSCGSLTSFQRTFVGMAADSS
jgi:hypothetical protein